MGKIQKTWEQDGENKAITHPGTPPSPWWYKGCTIRSIDARTRLIIELQPSRRTSPCTESSFISSWILIEFSKSDYSKFNPNS